MLTYKAKPATKGQDDGTPGKGGEAVILVSDLADFDEIVVQAEDGEIGRPGASAPAGAGFEIFTNGRQLFICAISPGRKSRAPEPAGGQ